MRKASSLITWNDFSSVSPHLLHSDCQVIILVVLSDGVTWSCSKWNTVWGRNPDSHIPQTMKRTMEKINIVKDKEKSSTLIECLWRKARRGHLRRTLMNCVVINFI